MMNDEYNARLRADWEASAIYKHLRSTGEDYLYPIERLFRGGPARRLWTARMRMLDCFPVGFTFGVFASLIFGGVLLRAG